MAQITLTAGANPAFLSKNYVNRDDVIAVSSSDSLKHRLYDMDFSSPWASSGSSDAVTETIRIDFYQGALAVSRSVDFIALMGINLKNFLLEYSADYGATYATVSGGNYQQGTADYASSNLILSLASPVSMTNLRLTMTRTQTANAEKQVAGMIAALGTFQTARAMSLYEPNRRDMRRTVKMADGSISFGYTFRSDNSFEFYECKVGWRFVTSSERTSFRAIKNTVEPVLWYPEPGDQVQDIFLCTMQAGTFKDPYSTTYKGAGYDIQFELEEVGGG